MMPKLEGVDEIVLGSKTQHKTQDRKLHHGLTEEDVELHLENRTLTLKGTRTMQKELKQEQFHQIERFYGQFSRSFTLPTNINKDGIRASFFDG